MKNLITILVICLSLAAFGCAGGKLKTSGATKSGNIKTVETSKMVKGSGHYSVLKSQPEIGKGIPLKLDTNKVSSSTLPSPKAQSPKIAPAPSVSENTFSLISVEPSEVVVEKKAEGKSFMQSVIFYYSVAIVLGIIAYVIYLKVEKYKVGKENPFKETYQTPKDKQLKLKL